MKCRHTFVFLSFLLLLFPFLFSLHIVSAYASTESGILLYVDNQRKFACPNELIQFDIDITSNRGSRENLTIRYAWENSVFWLPMDIAMGDDDQKVYDSSPFGNHGMLYNFDESSGWIYDNKLNRSVLEFDGVDDYLEIPNTPSLNPSNITVEAWVKSDTEKWNAHGCLVSKRNAYILHPNKGTKDIRFNSFYRGGVCSAIFHAPADFDITKWHHYVGTCSNTTVRLYVDSILRATETAAGELRTDDTGSLFIGWDDGMEGRYFDGAIDEVRIYNRALTAEEIKWLYDCSWNEKLSSYKVEMGPGENAHVTFSVKVPRGARPSHVQKFLLTAFPQSDPKYSETETVMVEVLEHYDGTISIDESEKSGKPGDILTFEAVIRNLGNIEDAFDILVESEEGWNLSFSPESMFLPPDGVGNITISLVVPLDARPEESASFEILAVSHGDPSLVVRTRGTAVATAIHNLEMSVDPKLAKDTPQSEVVFSLKLTNLGTAPDIFDLKAESAMGWNVEVNPTSLSLEAEEVGTATIKVRIPNDALIGQKDGITVQAISQGDLGASAESSISVEVVAPFWGRLDITLLAGTVIATGIFVGVILVHARSLGSIILKRSRSIRIAPLSLIVLCVASTAFLPSALTLGAFLLTLAIYSLRRYDSRLFVGTAISLLVACAALLAGGSEFYANEVAIWAYYFLVLGVIGLLIEYLRKTYRVEVSLRARTRKLMRYLPTLLRKQRKRNSSKHQNDEKHHYKKS